MKKFVVVTCRIPTNFNHDVSHVVEAATAEDARAIVKDSLRDLSDLQNYTYITKPYEPPPEGKILVRFRNMGDDHE